MVNCSGQLLNYNRVNRLIPPDSEVLLLQGNMLDECRLRAEDLENLTRLQILDLSYNEFQHVPLQLLPTLRELRVTDNSLSEVVLKDIGLVSGLQDINLSNNKLSSLTSGSSRYCRKKERRAISRQDLSLASVHTLTLDVNQLGDGELHALSILRNLTFLDLSKNNIQTIDQANFPILLMLETLKLDNNSIDSVIFPPLERLQNVSLRGNRLERLETNSFTSLRGLRNLDLSNNAITEIPNGTFEGLNLFSLQLQGNRLGEVQHGYLFDGLINVNLLELSYNGFSSIPLNFFKGIGNLRDLRLEHNLLKELAENTFDDVPNLRYLSLKANRLSVIYNQFYSLTILGHLNLQNNNISSIHKAATNMLPLLSEIHLDDNYLREVPHTFKEDISRQLTSITLSNNHIERISEKDFSRLINLKILDLRYNYIREIHHAAFRDLSSLTDLRLSHNRLSSLARGTLAPLSQLSNVSLHGNPWSCNCSQLVPLWECYNESRSMIVMEDDVTCTSTTDGGDVVIPLEAWESHLNDECTEKSLVLSSSVALQLVVIPVISFLCILILIMIIFTTRRIRRRRTSSYSGNNLQNTPPIKRVESDGVYEVPHDNGDSNLYLQPCSRVKQQGIPRERSMNDTIYVNQRAFPNKS